MAATEDARFMSSRLTGAFQKGTSSMTMNIKGRFFLFDGARLPSLLLSVSSTIYDMHIDCLVGGQEVYRVGEVLLGTGHGGDAHEGVVDCDTEVVDGHAGGAEEDKVSEGRFDIPPHGAADEIVDRDNLRCSSFRV